MPGYRTCSGFRLQKHPTMKTLKFFILFSILTHTAYSQCTYTPGPSTIELCNDNGVVIGGSLGCNACIKWTPATGLDDPHKLNPRANPQNTTVYTLELFDDEFNSIGGQSVTVIVDRNKQITAISASPECCYKRGDALNANNLNITTTPAGLEHNVEIDPSSVPADLLTRSVYNVNVTLKNTCGDQTLERTTTITAVDEDIEVGAGTSRVDPEQILNDAIEAIDRALGILPPNPCSPSISPTNGATVKFSNKCCKDGGTCDGVTGNVKVTGSVGVTGGIECNFPFAGIPYIASLDARLGVNASGTVSLEYEYNCANHNVCFELKPSASIYGGIAGRVLGGVLLDAALVIVASAEVKDGLKWCTGNSPPSTAQLCGNIAVEGSVVFLSGVASETISYKIIQDKCIFLN